jgi:hypothetical protein
MVKCQTQNEAPKSNIFKHPGAEKVGQSQSSIFWNLSKILHVKPQKPAGANLLLKGQSTSIETAS